MNISWTKTALHDLDGIYQYIAADSPHYAELFVDEILTATLTLVEFANIGRKVPEADERNDILELLFRNYRIMYTIKTKTIFILAIIHGNRDLKNLKPWEGT